MDEALHEGFDDIGVDLSVEGIKIFLQVLQPTKNVRNTFESAPT